MTALFRLGCFLFLFAPMLLGLTACGGGQQSGSGAEVDSVKSVTAGGDPSGVAASGGSSAAPATAPGEEPLMPPRTVFTKDTDPDPDPNDFVQVEFEAVPQNEDRIRKVIEYPAALKGGKVKGTVYVKVLIDKDGYYKKHIVRDSPDPALAQAVVDKVKFLYCSPARTGGKAVKVWVNFEHTFE